MSIIITLKTGVIALLGENSIKQCQIKNLAKTIDLKIQYNESPIKPIQIQIDDENWNDVTHSENKRKEEDKVNFYIKLLQDLEYSYGGKLYYFNDVPVLLQEMDNQNKK